MSPCPSRLRAGRRALLPGLLLWPLARCGAPPPPPAVLTLIIQGGADQNPDASGHAAPVAIRLYQLVTSTSFERADFFALTEREQATLGQDSAGSEEVLLAPSEPQVIRRELKKNVTALGVAVLFRDIDHAKWRAVAPLAASGPTHLTLTLSGTTVSLKPAA